MATKVSQSTNETFTHQFQQFAPIALIFFFIVFFMCEWMSVMCSSFTSCETIVPLVGCLFFKFTPIYFCYYTFHYNWCSHQSSFSSFMWEREKELNSWKKNGEKASFFCTCRGLGSASGSFDIFFSFVLLLCSAIALLCLIFFSLCVLLRHRNQNYFLHASEKLLSHTRMHTNTLEN